MRAISGPCRVSEISMGSLARRGYRRERPDLDAPHQGPPSRASRSSERAPWLVGRTCTCCRRRVLSITTSDTAPASTAVIAQFTATDVVSGGRALARQGLVMINHDQSGVARGLIGARVATCEAIAGGWDALYLDSALFSPFVGTVIDTCHHRKTCWRPGSAAGECA